MTPIYNFMSSARQSLDMTMYELSDSTAEQILIADHQRGVRVRVLLDHDYSGGSVNQAAYSTLSSAGVPVAWANDSEIFHQKTITVDGVESAIMTGNLTSQYYATTRDFVVMDSQPSDVAAIESVFSLRLVAERPITGSPGADLVWSPGSEPQLVTSSIRRTRSVVVENEEMDSTSIEDALESDASRGVVVTVVMTADSDWDAAFSQLESAGVHVVLYPDTIFGSVHPRQGDRRRRCEGLRRFRELLDGQPGLQPRAGHHHLVGQPCSGRLNSVLSSDISSGQRQQRTSTFSLGVTTAPRRRRRLRPLSRPPVAPRLTTRVGVMSRGILPGRRSRGDRASRGRPDHYL
jgi:5S rRNA maturation endonuclease (ribonuclease M5)